MTIFQKRHSPRKIFNPKTYLDTVLDKFCFKGTGDLYHHISSLTTVHRPSKDDRDFKAIPSPFVKPHQPYLLHPVNSRISSRF